VQWNWFFASFFNGKIDLQIGWLLTMEVVGGSEAEGVDTW